MNQDKPIFIGGLHRSGTSLMRAIIGSHPTVAIYQTDLPLWRKFYNRYKDLDLNDANIREQLIEKIFSDRKLEEAEVKLARDTILASLNAEKHITCGLVFEHILRQYAKQIGRPRWGLKTPYNEFFADAIFAAYPTAKMIHLLRDPRDVAVSIKSRGWDLTITQQAIDWKESVKLAQQNQQNYTGSYSVVRYEDLVSNPEAIIQQVCQVIELDYTPDLLKMDRQIGWRGSNSRFSDLGWESEEISPAAMGRYTKALSVSEIEYFQNFLKDEMISLHYTLQPL